MAGTLTALGLMSGTSADGIDAALITTDGRTPPRLLAYASHPHPAALKARILALYRSGPDELQRLGELDRELGERFADAALALLRQAGMTPQEVDVIGSHGQTVRHVPPLFTLQIGNPAIIAARTGVPVVADFRPADMAQGGEGAPLAPLFHRCLFARPGEGVVVVNLGGIANVTALPPRAGDPIIGGDCGPANSLMDLLAERLSGGAKGCDREGRRAARGRVDDGALAWLLAHPYLARPFPKSTGREEFGGDYLERFLAAFPHLDDDDRFATLSRFTAASVADACRRVLPPVPGRVVLAGGGARNPDLVARIAGELPGCQVATSDSLGIDSDTLEAQAFAWLAVRTLHGLPGNDPGATGAQREVVLGALHPAPGRPWPPVASSPA